MAGRSAAMLGALAGVAATVFAFHACFAVSAAPRAAPTPALGGADASQGAAKPQGRLGLAHLSGGLVVAAGLLALARRPSRTAMGFKIAIMTEDEPQPGSEKALQTMIGADVETGSEPWDPMGFSKLYDRNFDFNGRMTYPHVQWLREAEIKHGRVCMLAFVGMVVQQFVQIPGYPQEADWTKALTLCYKDKFATLGIIQISVFCMLVEGRWFPHSFWVGQGDREPGDLGFDPLKFTKKPDFDLKTMQLKELKNGRLAMIGVASLAANHSIPGSVPFLTGMY